MLTIVLSKGHLALVVDGEPHGPCRQVAHHYWTQAPVQPANALLTPNDARGADQAVGGARAQDRAGRLRADAEQSRDWLYPRKNPLPSCG